MLVFLKLCKILVERKILWSLCSIIFFAFALRLPIQTSLSVAPKLQVSLCSGGNCQKFRKTSTSQWWGQAGADQTFQWRTDWQIFRHFCEKSEVGCHRHIRKGLLASPWVYCESIWSEIVVYFAPFSPSALYGFTTDLNNFSKNFYHVTRM